MAGSPSCGSSGADHVSTGLYVVVFMSYVAGMITMEAVGASGQVASDTPRQMTIGVVIPVPWVLLTICPFVIFMAR